MFATSYSAPQAIAATANARLLQQADEPVVPHVLGSEMIERDRVADRHDGTAEGRQHDHDREHDEHAPFRREEDQAHRGRPHRRDPQRSDPPDPCIGDVSPHGVRDHPRPRHRAEHHADLARIEAPIPQQQCEEGREGSDGDRRSARRARGRRFPRGSPASCARHVSPGTSRAAFSRYTLRSTVSGSSSPEIAHRPCGGICSAEYGKCSSAVSRKR